MFGVAEVSKGAHQMTAIHGEDCTGHIARSVGREEEKRTIEVVKLSQSPLGYALQEGHTGGRIPELTIDVSFYIAWSYRVYADPVPSQLERHYLRELYEPRFGCRVRCHVPRLT